MNPTTPKVGPTTSVGRECSRLSVLCVQPVLLVQIAS
jgi:hypothetical protein